MQGFSLCLTNRFLLYRLGDQRESRAVRDFLLVHELFPESPFQKSARSHPKEGSAFVPSVTSQNPAYVQWELNPLARYNGCMKLTSPTVIALVLWLLFVASHAFAVFELAYPVNAERPDPFISISWHLKRFE